MELKRWMAQHLRVSGSQSPPPPLQDIQCRLLACSGTYTHVHKPSVTENKVNLKIKRAVALKKSFIVFQFSHTRYRVSCPLWFIMWQSHCNSLEIALHKTQNCLMKSIFVHPTVGGEFHSLKSLESLETFSSKSTQISIFRVSLCTFL